MESTLGLSSLLPVNLVASLSAYQPEKESSVNWQFMEMCIQNIQRTLNSKKTIFFFGLCYMARQILVPDQGLNLGVQQ